MSVGYRGVQLEIKSPSGERVGFISDNARAGLSINFRASIDIMGGLKSFQFELPPDSVVIPISINTVINVYINGSFQGSGYIKVAPQPSQGSAVLIYKGVGFYKKLSEVLVNQLSLVGSPSAILDSLMTTYLGFDVGVFKGDPGPVTTPSYTMSFENKPFSTVVAELIGIMNVNYYTARYYPYIDDESKLNIGTIDLSDDYQLIEGFDVHDLNVNIDYEGMANRIRVWTATADGSDQIAFKVQLENTESIGLYGLHQRKLVISDNVDLASATAYGDMFLDRYGVPTVAVTVPKTEGIIELSKAANFNTQRRNINRLIASCDTLDGWDLSGLSSASAAISETTMLTGRGSLKIDASLSSGEFLTFTPAEPIPFPTSVRLFVFYQSPLLAMSFTFRDSRGVEVEITPGATEPLVIGNDGGVVEVLQGFVNGVGLVDVYGNVVSSDVADVWTQFSANVGASQGVRLIDIESVKITILTDVSSSVYVDIFDMQTLGSNRHKVSVETVSYKSKNGTVITSAQYGEKLPSLVDGIKKEAKAGDVALAIGTKG